MARDEMKGSMRRIKGAGNEMLGRLTGDRSRELKGKAQQAGGRTQQEYGELKNRARRDDDVGRRRDRRI